MTIFTVGHSNRTLPDLIGLLADAAIQCLVDVRRYPTSTRYPHFNADNLRRACEAEEIAYHWAGEQLGGYRPVVPGSPHVALDEGLRGYADYMDSEAFTRNVARLTDLAARQTTVILCAEKYARDCHRRMIADYLSSRGIAVVHLVDPETCEPHELSHAVRLTQGKLIYDRLTQQSLPFDA